MVGERDVDVILADVDVGAGVAVVVDGTVDVSVVDVDLGSVVVVDSDVDVSEGVVD